MDRWEQYSPPGAPHVAGKYTTPERDPWTGEREPQRVEASCAKCRAVWKGLCPRGRVREHIERFARIHTHVEPGG